ncbi:L-amino acid oxidase [Diaporthe helianthi]|uniref:L-amino acid oxidase n=1 Tax=Diaporthe helianthi TaxID=158607 RepID=A0A2P5HEK4_DIAHE|nr:L-amino acid oxidase [Diaporthe helianthi]
MRIPLSPLHACVFEFVRYLNEQNVVEDKVEFIPYVLQHINNKVHLQGRVWDATDRSLAAWMELPQEFHNKTAGEMLRVVMDPWIALLKADFERGMAEVIDFVELIMSQTNQYDQSFTDLVLQTMHFSNSKWVTVQRGLSRIIDVAAKTLGPSCIFRNAPVSEIYELPDGKLELGIGGIAPTKRVFDKVVLAVSPAAIQQGIRTRPKWSYMKERAIQAIHEGPLYKIGLHFQTRFWEHTAEPCFGGQTQTDFRIRWIVYPSNYIGSHKSGCLMVYAGMTDALRWSWTTHQERVKLVMEDLNTFFSPQGVDIYVQFIEAFDMHWPSEAGGGNTMYLPGQYSRFHDVI